MTAPDIGPIGRIVFGADDGRPPVTLRADGTWDVPDDPDFSRILTGHYRDDFLASGPSRGQPGVVQLADLADLVGGEVVLESTTDGPPGTVY